MADDVRVRLSAEGVEQVVAAFRRVQVEAEKTGRAGSRNFAAMNTSMGSMKNAAIGLASAVAAIGFQRLVSEASDATEAVALLKDRFSDTLANLSSLDVFLRQIQSSLPAASRQLGQFLEKTQDAADGVGTAADELQRLGVTIEEIKKLGGASFSERIEIVARAMARIPASAEKSADQLKLVGGRGAALLPLFKKVGEEGMQGLIDRAQELGAVLDEETTTSVLRMNDAFDDLNIQTRAIATQVAAGLGPGIASAMNAAAGELTAGAQSWRTFGETVGYVIGFVGLAVVSMVDIVNTQLITMSSNVIGTMRGVAAAIVGDFREADRQFQAVSDRGAIRNEMLGKRLSAAWTKFFNPKLIAPVIPGTDDAEDSVARAERLANERIAIHRAEIDSTLALVKARNAAARQEEDAAFQRGIISVTTYYARRREIALNAIDAEIAALRQQRALIQDDTKAKSLEDVKRLNGQIQVLQVQRAATEAEITNDEYDAVQKLGKERLDIDRKIMEARGQQHELAIAQIRDQVKESEKLLDRIGTPAQEKKATLGKLEQSLTAREDFEQFGRQASNALSSMERERSLIQGRAADGLITQKDAEREILDLERDRIRALRVLANLMLEAANALGDPAAIAKAEEFTASVDTLERGLTRAAGWMQRLGVVGKEALEAGIADAFSTAGDDAWVFGEKMRALAVSVVASMQRMIAEMLAAQAVAAAFKFFGAIIGSVGGGGKSTFGNDFGGGGGGGVVQADAGGLITGPAMLTAGEFVVNPVSTRRHLSELRSINGGLNVRARGVPGRYADGGLVTPSSGSAGGQTNITIALEKGLILETLDTPDADRISVRRLARNRRGVNRILGG